MWEHIIEIFCLDSKPFEEDFLLKRAEQAKLQKMAMEKLIHEKLIQRMS